MKTRSSIQAECLQRILPLNRCGVVLTMRTGKTLLGLTHMSKSLIGKKNPKFLVVAPKKSIFKSWRDDAKKFGLEFLLEYITFTTYLSLKKQDIDQDGIYLDEMHSLLDSHEPWLSSYKGKILGLTGSKPQYEESEKAKLIERFCPIAYEYLLDEAVEDGILNDYKITVHLLSLSDVKNFRKKTKDGRFWMTSERADYDYWTNQIETSLNYGTVERARILRMNAMMKYSTKEDYARRLFQSIEGKCILFCNTIDQAHRMSAHSYTSKNPKSEKNLEMLSAGDIDKMTAVHQISEGITIPGLANVVIMHSFSGNSAKTKQRFGRTQGLDPSLTGECHILCFKDSADTHWVKGALADMDQTKITYREVGIN